MDPKINAGQAPRWQDELYDELRRNNITQFAYWFWSIARGEM
jgi:hypothetical protein